jgi:hypothetical protein
MTNTKARRERDLIDEVVALKRDKAKQYGRARQDASVSSAQGVPLGGSGKKGSSDSNANNDIYLSTIGGTMMGPLAFYLASATIADGVIDISKASGNYSSRMLVIGEGGVADDLEVILNASFAGQILFFQPIQAITLQSYLKTATAWATSTSYSVGDVVLDSSQRYTCHTAHTSSSATDPGSGADWETVWYRNNIRVTGATERVVAIDEIVMLQYDSTDSVWTVISGGGTSGSGGAGLGDTNVWTASNTFQSAVSMTGASVIIGDASTDLLYINSTISGNVDFGGNDIQNIDKVDFQVTGQRFNSTNTSIQYEVPSGDVHKFLVSSATKMTLSTTELLMTSGCNIKLPYGSLVDFNASVATTRTGGSAAALPSTPVGYIYVKVVGVDSYIPFYS